jgi:hypothetical protein
LDEVTLNPTAKYSSSEILIEGSTSKTIKLDDDKKTIISVVVAVSTREPQAPGAEMNRQVYQSL